MPDKPIAKTAALVFGDGTAEHQNRSGGGGARRGRGARRKQYDDRSEARPHRQATKLVRNAIRQAKCALDRHAFTGRRRATPPVASAPSQRRCKLAQAQNRSHTHKEGRRLPAEDLGEGRAGGGICSRGSWTLESGSATRLQTISKRSNVPSGPTRRGSSYGARLAPTGNYGGEAVARS